MSGLDAIRLDAVLEDIEVERFRQHDRFGEQNHPDGTGTDFDTQMRDLAQDACDAATDIGAVMWRDILLEEVFEALAESGPEKLRAELVQVAAVSVAWVEAIDRRI